MPLTFVPEYEFSRPMGFVPSSRRPHDAEFAVGSLGAAPRRCRLLELFPYAFQFATEDQRQTSTCTGNAVVELAEFLDAIEQAKGADGIAIGSLKPDVEAALDWTNFSRMFPYYFGREKRGWQTVDAGAVIADVFEAAGSKGICLEPWWMFKEANVNVRPDARAIAQAARHLLVNPRRVAREAVREVLSGGGDATKARPIVCGVQVYQHRFFSPEVQKTGWIDLPSKTTDYAGGHALLFAGYDDQEDWTEGPNSWGKGWAFQSVCGRPGWFRMHMQYLRDPKLSSDFWTGDYIRTKERA